MNDIDDLARKALAANTKTPWRTKVSLWLEGQSAAKIFFVIVIFGGLSGFTIYEGLNASAGWGLIARSAVPDLIARLFGFALVLGVIGFHRRASEALEEDRKSKALRDGIAGLGCMALALLGVFSNLASKTEMQAGLAQEANLDRAELRAELSVLRQEASDEALLNAQTVVSVTERLIASREAEAAGWGMEGTDPADCAGDLRIAQRQICNDLNGDGNDMGYRNELEVAKARVTVIEGKRERLVEVQDLLSHASRREGDAHWRAMSDVSLGRYDESDMRVWSTFFASLVLLIVLGFGWDGFFDRREAELEEALRQEA